MAEQHESSAEKPMSKILVTGDFLIDHHIYEGRRHHFGDHGSRGVCVTEELGGGALIHRLLNELQADSAAVWKSVLAVNEATALTKTPACSSWGAWYLNLCESFMNLWGAWYLNLLVPESLKFVLTLNDFVLVPDGMSRPHYETNVPVRRSTPSPVDQ